MSDKYRNTLITKPAIKLVLFIALVVGLLVWIPIYLESTLNGLSIFKKTGNEASLPPFPFFIYLVVPLATSLPLLIRLITGISAYRKWMVGSSPVCPSCQGPMIQRTAKKGQFRDQKFWGCYTFPACTGKEHIGW